MDKPTVTTERKISQGFMAGANFAENNMFTATVNNPKLQKMYSDNTLGPYLNQENNNVFITYQQLAIINPHVTMSIMKLALTIIKGLRFSGDANLVKDFEVWSKNINFRETIQTMTRLLAMNGTYVGLINNPKDPATITFEPLLMQTVTLLPKGYKVMDTAPNVIVTGPPVMVVLNESDEILRKTYKIENCVYGALFPHDFVFQDVMYRDTYGIYGISLLAPIEDLIRKYMNLIEGYTNYIRKYGIGRYFINYKVLESLITDGQIEQAKVLLDELAVEHEYIAENQDIIGAGFDIKQLDTGGSNINVVGFKESLEKDIQIGLLQAPITMGRAEGTTYAAGYVSESDRLVVLEGIQKLVQDMVNSQFIKARLVAMGKDPLTSDIKVEFEELSRPNLETKDSLAAYQAGLISEQEWRQRTGFPPEKSKSETFIKVNLQPSNQLNNHLNNQQNQNQQTPSDTQNQQTTQDNINQKKTTKQTPKTTNTTKKS